MKKIHSEIAIFENIESQIKDKSFLSFATKKLKSMKHKLYTATSTSRTPQFQRRWERVEAALEAEITRRKEKCRFRIAIFSAVIAFATAIITFLSTS